jgi:GntR family transcriptional repressor for pyruvate dehydrogenase complex
MKKKSKDKKVKSTVSEVMNHLRKKIRNGEYAAGDILPAERKLAEELNASRGTIRDAIKKLEFYGMVKIEPQSGTKIKGSGLVAFEGLISEILNFEKADFTSLVETRNLLEIKSAGTAALKRTESDIIQIVTAMKAYENKIKKGKSAREEDYHLHLQITEVSGNSVLKLLMRIITPDIMNSKMNTDKEAVLIQHREIVEKIIAKDAKGAKNAMRLHLRGTTKSS